MGMLRNRIENRFEEGGLWIARNPLKVILTVAVLLAALIMHLPKITMDTSTEGFLFDDDPALVEYNAFRDRYGRDERVVLAIGPVDVFTPEVLSKVRAIHERIEAEVPYLADVSSLLTARNTRGEGDRLVVEDLLEEWPDTPEKLAAVKARALGNVFYKNLLLSEDGRYTTIVIETLASADDARVADDVLAGFDELSAGTPPAEPKPRQYLTDKQNTEVVVAVKRIMAEFNSEALPIQLAGSPVVTHFLKSAMAKDMQTFVKLLILIIAVTLFLIFRRVTGVFYPLIAVILTLLATVGFMGLTGAAIKLPTQILPSLILAVGIGASVHVLALFYRKLDETGDKPGAISYALGHSGLAIVMTSLTTMAGIGSFSMAEVAPIADLGRFAAFGVFVSLILTLTLLPALLAITPLKPRELHPEKHPVMDRILMWIADVSTTYARGIVITSAVIIVVGLAVVTQVKLSHFPLHWFPKTDETRMATETLDKVMKGTINAEVILDWKETNALYPPRRMQALADATTEAESFTGDGYFVGKTVSIATILKETNRALHENQEEAYRIPDNKDLIAQELLLFSNSGSDDLEDVTDSQFSQARVTHKMPFVDAVKGQHLVERLERYYKEMFADAEVTVTGIMPLLARVFGAAVESMGISYLIAFASIGVMMNLLLGSIRLGLISIVPNLSPIVLAMAVMVVAGVPFDMFMMLVGSIVIGLAVDDTIHFMHNFRRYYNVSHDAKEAVRHTLLTTGRAITVTTIVLSLGFFVYMFATMNSVFNFGMITGIAIVLALIADFFVAPALMVLFVKSQKKEEEI